MLDFSARGWGRVILITVCGTLLCIAVPVAVDLLFMDFAPADLAKSLRNDVLLPLLLATPLLSAFSYKMRQLAIAQAELQVVASTDSLTAVLNRGAFTMLVDAYLNAVRDQEVNRSGALLIVDADHFKSINDRFGHESGDEALKIIAGSIRGLVRNADLVGRIGGEEFGVFLPGSSPSDAAAVAERIRVTVSSAAFSADGKSSPLSVSVGGAVFARSVDYAELYRVADRQLYQAKQSGRNRVSLTHMPGSAAALH
ncbi:MAG: GGDEF domain-containing protein [Rhizobiaceae bacterium]|nr:GGDEF domain-containing protein [Rhizobiaceae bacterium]